jgi:hypothetical protein
VSYRDGINYLSSKTRLFEMCNQFGGRVVVCPDWGGRVMTSSCDGIDGHSFGLINVREIEALQGKNYGGEDHLMFSSGGHFEVDSLPHDPMIRMRRSIRTPYELDIVRIVRLLNENDIRLAFGDDVAVSLEQADISYVAFSTVNTIVNPSKSHAVRDEYIAFRLSSMFNSGQNSVAIIPFRPKKSVSTISDVSEELREMPVETEFFGTAPHGRLRILSRAVLLRADGKYRCQIAVPRNRAVSVLGAVDFREGFLTLTAFDMTESKHDDEMAVRAYNHGPMEPNEADCARYYGFEVFSPIRNLPKGESLTHHQHTLHITADNRTLDYLVQKVLGVEYGKVYDKMMK